MFSEGSQKFNKTKASANVRQSFFAAAWASSARVKSDVLFNSLVRLPERQWAWRYLTQVQNFSDQKLFKVLLVYLPEPEVALGFCSCSPVMRQWWCFLYSWPSPDKWKSLHFGKLKRVLKYFSPYLWIWVACEYIWERHFCLLFQKMGGGG